MLDLSNNNGGYINFPRLHQAGQRRVYLKATEGMHFIDKTYKTRLQTALASGFKVGAYHFGNTDNSAELEALRFHSVVGRLHPGKSLRPALDFESGVPNARWAERFLNKAEHLFGVRPIIYSYGDFLHRAGFHIQPAELWLASYGRNDGLEHPFSVPAPFSTKHVVAHQFASTKRMAGVQGDVDISHVFKPKAIDVPRLSIRRLRTP